MQTSFNISHDLSPVVGFFRCRLGNQRAKIARLDGWQNSSADDKKKEVLRKEVASGLLKTCWLDINLVIANVYDRGVFVSSVTLQFYFALNRSRFIQFLWFDGVELKRVSIPTFFKKSRTF